MAVRSGVLQQKLRQASPARSPLPDAEVVGQDLVRGIEKAFRPLVKTTISAIMLEARVVKVSEATTWVSIPAALGIVGIDASTSRGLVAIDADLAFNLIDLMMGGDPSQAPAPVTRPFTPIDMTLCRMVSEAALDALSDALAAALGRKDGQSFAVLSQHQDITQVRLAGPNTDALVYNVTLDMGPAARSGGMQVFLPLALLDVVCGLAQEATAPKAAEDEVHDLWSVNMRRAAAAAPVRMTAVLQTRRMPMSAVMGLRKDMVLEVPAAAIEEVKLVVTQRGGRPMQVSTGKLGVQGDRRAIRLDEPLDARLVASVRKVL